MIDSDQPMGRHTYMAPYSLPYITINATRANFDITQTLPWSPTSTVTPTPSKVHVLLNPTRQPLPTSSQLSRFSSGTPGYGAPANLHRHPYTVQSPGWTEAAILKSFTYFTVNIIFTFRNFIYFSKNCNNTCIHHFGYHTYIQVRYLIGDLTGYITSL
jgi:hypothetical protein